MTSEESEKIWDERRTKRGKLLMDVGSRSDYNFVRFLQGLMENHMEDIADCFSQTGIFIHYILLFFCECYYLYGHAGLCNIRGEAQHIMADL